MDNGNLVVKRTFDLLDRYSHMYADLPVALGGKEAGQWKTYSPQEYINFVNLISYAFLSLGLKKGDKVATVTNNRPEWNFIDLGLAQIGVVHVPIYPTISIEEYQYILNHCESQYVIVGDKKLYEKIGSLVGKTDTLKDVYSFDAIPGVKHWLELTQLGETYAKKGELETIKQSIDEQELVTIIYTSGTTGVPKGVMLSHRNLVSNFTQHSQNHNLGKGASAISFLPLCHVFERVMNYHYQYKGMSIYYIGNLGQIMPALKEIKPHMFCTVPRLLERIYDGILNKGNELKGIKRTIFYWAITLGKNFDYGKRFGLFYNWQRKLADKLVYSKWRDVMGGRIEIIVSGGAALQPRIGRILGVANIDTLEGYGLTETSPVIAVSNPAKREIRVGTVGPILPGVDVKFAEDGEILCKGPNVMLGYYKEPEMTKNVIDEEGYFHTGDIGMLVEGKYLKITDRKKEIFKLSGGKYVAPQVIENKLKESMFIEQAMVIGENEKFASALISPAFAYVENWCKEKGIETTSREELINHPEVMAIISREVNEVNKTLGQVEELKRYRLVADEWTSDTGELSPTQKLKRNVLAAKYSNIIEEIFTASHEEDSKGFKIKIPRINLTLNELINRLKTYANSINSNGNGNGH
jgi:long-chain acyl-CoA synthetase